MYGIVWNSFKEIKEVDNGHVSLCTVQSKSGSRSIIVQVWGLDFLLGLVNDPYSNHVFVSSSTRE